MSDFWQKRLGTPPAPRTAPLPAQRAWWDDTPQSAPQPETVAPIHPGEHIVPTPPTDLPSTRNSGHCPSCYSENYFKGTANSAWRCYDCGYPIQHSTSGVISTTSSNGPAIAARQVSTANNYNPGIIIGRV